MDKKELKETLRLEKIVLPDGQSRYKILKGNHLVHAIPPNNYTDEQAIEIFNYELAKLKAINEPTILKEEII